MVQGAIQYNRKGKYTRQEIKDYGTQLEIDRKRCNGTTFRVSKLSLSS